MGKKKPNVDHILEIQLLDKVWDEAPVAVRTRAGLKQLQQVHEVEDKCFRFVKFFNGSVYRSCILDTLEKYGSGLELSFFQHNISLKCSTYL